MKPVAASVPAPHAIPASCDKPWIRDHPVEVHTRIELVRTAYAELMPSTVASSAAAFALAVPVWLESRDETAWGWLAGMMIIAAYRTALAFLFRRAKPSDAEYSSWGAHFVLVTTATGFGWGMSTWLLPTLSPGNPLALLHVVLLSGLAMGATRLLLPMRIGSLAYVLSLMSPLALRFAIHGGPTGPLLGSCAVVLLAYMLAATLRGHRTLADALRLRFEREALTERLTAEIARRQTREMELQEARERAEAANRAKGEFLATISHEIRTPMNGVLGMLRVVGDTPLTPEQRGFLKTASDSAESLLLLLSDVLDFSKIEAGRLEIEHAPFRPCATVRAVSDLLMARARDKGLRFEIHFGEKLPGILIGDSTRLRQILLNLLGNAIKFTERGSVELSVSCIERTESKAWMQFTVVDTGIGINSAALDRLFKPFSQADTSMSRRYGGTGLGLAISMRLAKAMGGTLHVQSAVKKGTTFRLTVPCDLPEATNHAHVAPRPRFEVPSLCGRVLVVEDDAVNQQVIELFLKKLNVTPKFATDGEGAIQCVTAETFDVILMDCQLPGIDGLETTREIRRKLSASPVKIIALTANASTHVREACLAAGMNDFLTKPVRFELLAGVLQRHLPAASDPAPTLV